MPPDCHARAAIVLAVLALVCGGCDAWTTRKEKAAAETAKVASEAATPAASAPKPPVSTHALPTASAVSLAGLWRVVTVDGDKEGIVGALMDIDPQQLQWSYKPPANFPGGEDVCGDPWIGPIEGAAGDAILHARFAAALKRMEPGAKLNRTPYEIECRASGRWGPGKVGTAHLYRLGQDDMLMSWHGDRILRLRLIKPSGNAAASESLPLHADDPQ